MTNDHDLRARLPLSLPIGRMHREWTLPSQRLYPQGMYLDVLQYNVLQPKVSKYYNTGTAIV